MIKEKIYIPYKSGEEPKVNDLVLYDGVYFPNKLAIVKEIVEITACYFIVAEWLDGDRSNSVVHMWPWYLTLIRRDARKLMSWI